MSLLLSRAPLFIEGFTKSCFDAGVPMELTACLLQKAGSAYTPAELLLQSLGDEPFSKEAGLGSPHAAMGRASQNTDYAPGRFMTGFTGGDRSGQAEKMEQTRRNEAGFQTALHDKIYPEQSVANVARSKRNQDLLAYHDAQDAAAGFSRPKAWNGDPKALLPPVTPAAPAAPAAPPTAAIAQNKGESMHDYLGRMHAAAGSSFTPPRMSVPAGAQTAASNTGQYGEAFSTGGTPPAAPAAPVIPPAAPIAPAVPGAIASAPAAPVAAPTAPPGAAPAGYDNLSATPATAEPTAPAAPAPAAPAPKPVAAAPAPEAPKAVPGASDVPIKGPPKGGVTVPPTNAAAAPAAEPAKPGMMQQAWNVIKSKAGGPAEKTTASTTPVPVKPAVPLLSSVGIPPMSPPKTSPAAPTPSASPNGLANSATSIPKYQFAS